MHDARLDTQLILYLTQPLHSLKVNPPQASTATKNASIKIIRVKITI